MEGIQLVDDSGPGPSRQTLTMYTMPTAQESAAKGGTPIDSRRARNLYRLATRPSLDPAL
jgi:hypothetical protein